MSRTEFGLYFSWGNTDGHTFGDGYSFSAENYEASPGHLIEGNIPLSQDAARANMGGGWRMPSRTEATELIENCDYSFTEIDGVAGALMTSRNNGESIFIPASGYLYGDGINGEGTTVDNWLIEQASETAARRLTCSAEQEIQVASAGKRFGYAIRAVLDP